MPRGTVWFWVGLAVGLAGACRGHDDVCVGDECVRRLPEAGGGAAGEAAVGLAGAHGGEAGQSEIVASCASDDECDNGAPCDGYERCSAAGCEPGEAVECANGMRCDGASGSCVYRRKSPWLLVNRDDGVEGLPVAELGKRPLLALWREPAPAPWSSLSLRWSPNGGVAFFIKHEGQLSFSYWGMRFGAGAPSELALLRDVPNLLPGAEGPDVSRDSRYALSFDPYSGLFLTSLLDDDEPTRLVATPQDGVERARFCARGNVWLEEYADGRMRVAELDGGELTRRELAGSPRAEFSLDRRLLVSPLADREEAGLVLEPCDSASKWSFELPGAASARFSEDGFLLLIELATGGQKVMLVEQPENVVELCRTDGSSLTFLPHFGAPYAPSIDQDTWPMLARQGDALVVVDVMACAQPPQLLSLPTGAELALASERALVGSSALLAWATRDDGSRDLIRQSFDPVGEPRLVLNVAAPARASLFVGRHDPERAWLVSVRDGRSTLTSIWLDAPDAVPLEQLAVEGEVTRVEPASDDSGLVLVIDGSAYWAAAQSTAQYAEPLLLAESISDLSMQPW